MRRPISLTLVLILASALLSGCNKPSAAHTATTPAPAAQTADASAVDLYNARRYADALARAEQDMLSTKDRDHEVAQLTAGLSAYALNRTAVAQTYLESLTSASDPQIAGRAETVLGQIADKQGNHVYAADLFKRAKADLSGDPAAQAALRAGTSRQADGLTVSKPAAKAKASGPFAIQVGAFTSRAGANKRVVELRPKTIKVGLGSPRIIPDTIGGKPGFSVQVGIFPDKSSAAAAKAKLGDQYVIVAAE